MLEKRPCQSSALLATPTTARGTGPNTATDKPILTPFWRRRYGQAQADVTRLPAAHAHTVLADYARNSQLRLLCLS